MEEVAVFLPHLLLTHLHVDRLAGDDQAVRFLALDRLVLDLGDVLGRQPQVLEVPLGDDRVLHVRRLRTRLGGYRIPRRARQRPPRRRLDQFRPKLQVQHGVDAKQELHVALCVPAVQVGGLGEVGVAAEQDALEPASAAQVDRLVQVPGGILMTRPVARSVQQEQRLLGVGQGDDQRVITPLPVVADVHPLFALGAGWGERAVGVDPGPIQERRLMGGVLPPDLETDGIERLLQRIDLPGRLEPPAEVAGRGRVGNAPGPQGIEVGLVVAEQLQVLNALPAAQEVVGEVQDVIRFVVRQVDLEQVQLPVDGVDQADPSGEQVDRPDAAVGDGPRAVGHVAVDVAGRQHGFGPGVELPRAEAFGNAALASEPLLACTGIHSKRLLACACQKS